MAAVLPSLAYRSESPESNQSEGRCLELRLGPRLEWIHSVGTGVLPFAGVPGGMKLYDRAKQRGYSVDPVGVEIPSVLQEAGRILDAVRTTGDLLGVSK